MDFGDCDDSAEGWVVGEITAYDRPRHFAYRAGPDAPETRWTLQPDGGGCLLTFRPADEPLLVVVTGWYATLDNLARVIAGQPRLSDAEFVAREADVAGRYRNLPGVI